MTVAESQAAAAFIATYEERDDLIFVVVTNEYFKLHWEPLLPAALKRCGATSALHKLPASDDAWVYGHYLLVGQCGRGVAWSAQHGLEMSNADTGTALQLEVDVDATFELWNGDSHAGFNFTYAPALTPTLVSVSRLNGTTAGQGYSPLQTAASAGISWVGENGFIGVAFKQTNALYGVPGGHAHGEEEHEDEHDDDHLSNERLGLFGRRARRGNPGEPVAVGPRAEPALVDVGVRGSLVLPDDLGRPPGEQAAGGRLRLDYAGPVHRAG